MAIKLYKPRSEKPIVNQHFTQWLHFKSFLQFWNLKSHLGGGWLSINKIQTFYGEKKKKKAVGAVGTKKKKLYHLCLFSSFLRKCKENLVYGPKGECYHPIKISGRKFWKFEGTLCLEKHHVVWICLLISPTWTVETGFENVISVERTEHSQ